MHTDEGTAASYEVIGCLQRVQGEEGSGERCLGAEQHCVCDRERNTGQPLPEERLQMVLEGGSCGGEGPQWALRMKLRRTCSVAVKLHGAATCL